jgi:hypothetical protein
MRIKFSTICFSFFFAMFLAATAFSQIDASSPNGRPQPKEELPKNIMETLAKQRIEREKKDYEELVKRSEEAVKLSEELEKSFSNSNQLSTEDLKKLEKLEKLVKKIRGELGGDDDGEQGLNTDKDKNEQPSTMVNAFKVLKSNTVQLFDEIKKSTRYSVSVIAIQTSNMLLKLVKFIRFGK